MRGDRSLPDSYLGALTQAVVMRVGRPQVKADPQQFGAAGVWTTREDVLPGEQVQDDALVAATWGDIVWFGWATWDRVDQDLLWLQPLTGLPIPSLWAAHPLLRVVDDVIDALLDSDLLRDSLAAYPAHAIVTSRLEMVYDDVDDALTRLVEVAARRRRAGESE